VSLWKLLAELLIYLQIRMAKEFRLEAGTRLDNLDTVAEGYQSIPNTKSAFSP